MLNLKAGNCQKQSQLFSVHLNQLYMHDTGALQRVHHSVSAWVKLDLCLFRFVEQLLQLVHIRVLPHLQTNESRNKWAKFIRCPSWSFWLREGSGRKLGDGVKRWSCSFIWYSRASLEIQSGGQSDPDEFGRPATAFPLIRLFHVLAQLDLFSESFVDWSRGRAISWFVDCRKGGRM